MNAFVIVGQVQKVDQPAASGGNMPGCELVIRTRKPFRSREGMAGDDVFRVSVWRGIAGEIADIVEPGMWVACRGRLQTECLEEEGKNRCVIRPVAEHISFPDRA
jgi:single-stranded DNA-binding protein